jgi:hypothetical protein
VAPALLFRTRFSNLSVRQLPIVKLDVAGNLESAIDQALAQGELDRAEVLAQEYRAAAAGDSAGGLSPRFRSCCLAAQVALAAGRFEKARERLTELLPLPAETPPVLACRLELMFAEVLARLGQAALARGRLIRAQVHAGVLADNPLLKLRELRIRLWLGQVERLGDELAECDRALEQLGDLANRSLLTCEEGRAWDAKGRPDRAGECWARAEEWTGRSAQLSDVWRADGLDKLLGEACRLGDAASVLQYQESKRRGQMPEFVPLSLAALPELTELERSLAPGEVYIAPTILEDNCYLLICRRGMGAQVVGSPGNSFYLAEQVEQLRRCIEGQVERYSSGHSLSPADRAEIDRRLEDIGDSCLGKALWNVLKDGERILWAPDDILHGVPLHALRRDGRYLIETHEVLYTLGGSFLVHQAQSPVRRRHLTRALVLCESPTVLPSAQQEGEGVAATFWRSRVLRGAEANRAALRQYLPEASVVHLACRAWYDVGEPSSPSIRLPSSETWSARDWLDEPLDGLPLVTLSECRSTEGAGLTGREAFGLVTGLLAGGVRSVVANLWPIPDCEAMSFMWQFYRERMTADVLAALARAQRESLRQGDSSPLFWAAFAHFGDPNALPAPPRWLRWLARWRQARHARYYPTPQGEGSS